MNSLGMQESPHQFTCPHGHLLQGFVSQGGHPCQCPHCGVTFVVPPAMSPNSSEPRSDEWYVLQNQVQYGPFSFEQLRHSAASGQLFGHDLVGRKEDTTWFPAGSIAGLAFASQASLFSWKIGRAMTIIGSIAGCLIGLWLIATPLLGTGGASTLRDFGDNTASYKGKTLKFKLAYEGQGLDRWVSGGTMPVRIDVPFRASGFVQNSHFSFVMHVEVPADFKVPPLRSSEEAWVTFECTEGELHSGNIAKKIVRP